MTGTTGAAWNDPARGGELAKAQFAKGADVVFAAAGGTGIGRATRPPRTAASCAIGVDSNQNHLHPGTMLTSMVKRVDVAVYNVGHQGHQARAVTVLGLEGRRRGRTPWTSNNAKLVTADMKTKVDAAKADIIARQDQGRWTTWRTTPANADPARGLTACSWRPPA